MKSRLKASKVVSRKEFKETTMDARRALRWCERLFCLVDKLERSSASHHTLIRINNELVDRICALERSITRRNKSNNILISGLQEFRTKYGCVK